MKIEMEVNSISIFIYDKIIPLELFWGGKKDGTFTVGWLINHKPETVVELFVYLW